jgi:glutathione peroxidase
MNSEIMKSFYDLKVKKLNGEDFDFDQLRGKRVLIVNTASECGFTPQYAQLQELYELYGGENFTIIGFPSNDFGGQEPGSNAEIAGFCQKNYGVTFPMMDKIAIKGDDAHPLYRWLTQKSQNGVGDAEVRWNFNKFLVDENGNWVAHYGSKTEPLDEEILEFVKGE